MARAPVRLGVFALVLLAAAAGAQGAADGGSRVAPHDVGSRVAPHDVGSRVAPHDGGSHVAPRDVGGALRLARRDVGGAPRLARREVDAARRLALLYGVTLDRISGLRGLLAGLRALPHRPTVRVYFDVREPAAHYRRAIARIAKVSEVMGELLDSSDERSVSVADMRSRARSYARSLRRYVGIWEVGNEVNGSWTGAHRAVSAKLRAAYDGVRGTGAKTALTLYANDFGPDHCGDGRGELTPLQFARRWVPIAIAHGLAYVLLSYYPTECGGREPSPSIVAAHLNRLRAVFPNAALGFGEVGLPHRVPRAPRARAAQIMRWAYSLRVGVPYYVGGYFWWYAAEDALRPGAPLAGALKDAFRDEAATLGR